jgi:hypothetical protein
MIVIMRITHLRQADLNLLVVFTALAEERNVTRAAARLLLSQPAVSRALQRLREMFRDDLLIRTPSGYEPTPKGERLLRELSTTLPRLDRLLSGAEFDPTVKGGGKVSHRGGAKGNHFFPSFLDVVFVFGGGWSEALRRPQGGAFRTERKPPPNTPGDLRCTGPRAIACLSLSSSGCS